MPLLKSKSQKSFNKNVETEMKSGKPQDQSLAIAYSIKRGNKRKKMAEGGVASPTKTNTKTGGSNPGGASTGGLGSGIGGAGTGGAATGGASTGGAGTVNVTLSGNSGTGSNSGGSSKKGKDKEKPVNINISHVGGKTGAGEVTSGDGPGSSGTGGRGEDSGSGGTGGGRPDDEDNDLEYAEGGEVSASNEERPMPNNRYNDSKMVGRNKGNKPPGEDSWTDDPTVRQAQRPSLTRLSRPKMAGTDVFSVRDRDDVDKDLDRMDSEYPESDKAQPRQRYDEMGANRQGPKVPDMEQQHNNHKPPYTKETEDQYSEDMANANMKKTQSPLGRYAQGGVVGDTSSDVPTEEAEEMRSNSIAAAIMAKKDRMRKILESGSMDEDEAVKFYEGGQVEGSDESMVDLDLNSMEQPNAYYGRNEDDVLKENYAEDMMDMSQPEDSNQTDDEREERESDPHDMVDSIRRKMKSKRQFKSE